MNRFAGWTLCVVIMTGVFAGQGCGSDAPEGSGLDALDGGVDVGGDADLDADIGRDALVSDVASEDAGPTDVGLCNCSFGFHQQCAADELCMAHYVRSDAGQPACTPVGSASTGGIKNAQCTTEIWDGCLNNGSDKIASAWSSGISRAAFEVATATVPAEIPYDYFLYARDETRKNAVCGELIKWTVVAMHQLCQGDDTVIPPDSDAEWYDLWAWKFTNAPAVDPCVDEAGNRCVSDLYDSLYAQKILTERLSSEFRPEECSDRLPYGSPCGELEGDAAPACIGERLRAALRILLHK